MALADTAKLVAVLELDPRKFQAGTKAALGSLGKLQGGISKGIGAIGTAAAVGIGIASAGAIAVLKTSIGEASNLAETVSKVGVVFDKQAVKVLAFGDTAAAALGLSQNAALAGAATFGNLFKAMDIGEARSADMSIALVKLASDLASFNNLDPAEVLDKLRAGLTGESEPLKSLGVNINETIIKAKALELGLVETTASTTDLRLKSLALAVAQKKVASETKKYGKDSLQALKATQGAEKAAADLEKATKKIPATLTAAQKAQASYALIFEQTSTAQGDFARTSDGLANQQRILRANLSNTAAVIGSALLPKVADLAKRINTFVVDNQPKIAELAAQLPAVFDRALELGQKIPWEQIGKGLETSARFAGDLINVFASMPPEAQAAIIGLASLNKLTGGAVGTIVSELGKGLIKGVLGMTAGVVHITAASVTGGGGVPGVPGTGGGILDALKFALPVIGGVFAGKEFSNFLRDNIQLPTLKPGERLGDWIQPTEQNTAAAADKLDLLNSTTDTKLGDITSSLNNSNAIIRQALGRPIPAPIVNNNISVNISPRDLTSVTTSTSLASYGIASGKFGPF